MKNLRITHSASKMGKSDHAITKKSRFLTLSDAEVWDAFREGDENALIFIYDQYFPLLFNYACQFSQDRDFIKDCIQDLFVDLFKSRIKLSGTTSIKFYLYRSLRRRLTKNNLWEKVWVRTDAVQGNAFGLADSAEKQLLEAEEGYVAQKVLKKAIDSLPNRQKEAVFYYFYENFSYEQIAELMDMSKVKSARTLIYRAIDNLRGKLSDEDGNKLIPFSTMISLLAISYAAANQVHPQTIEFVNGW